LSEDAGRLPRRQLRNRTGDGGVKNQFALEQNDAVTRGEVARFNDNYAALEILKAEKPFHTKEELLTLSRYTGWGGVQNLFPRPDGSFDSNSWRDRNTAFRELVTKEEYEAAEKSILDAFYTPPKIIGAMWKISQRLGFDGGHVLEPSAGTGRFIGMVPPGISRVSFDGIELDPVTAKIAAILYPKSNIRNIGFEKTNYPESFEMVIGNPPYGDFTIYDPNEKELSRLNIHNYFMAKSLKALKPGGVLNFVITASFMENLNVTTVRAIDGQAKLVGAIRLPSNIFKASGTEVTTDIVIFQKLQPGEKGNAAEWFGRVKQPSGINLNKYFDAHPEMLLGKWEKGFRGNRAVAETDNIDAQLNAAIGLLPEKIVPSFQGELREQLIAAADTSVTPSVMYEKNGKYFVNIKAGEWYDVIEMKGELPKSYIPLRDALKRVIDMQNSAAATESDLTGARRALNVQYDAFVKKHGPLNKAQNRNLIVNDNYGYTVLALEIDGKKAPIFTTRTSSPVRNVKTKDAKEALTITVNTRGRVDMETMTDITGKSEAELVTELRGEIFFDDKENRYVTKEVYLSGDVKSKLATATDQLAIDALLKVIPEDKKAQDIPVQMGVSWIGPEHIRLFAQEVMGFRNIAVTFNKELAKWDVKGSSFSNPFEIPQYNAADTLEYALNQKRMTIKETINKKSYVNEEATAYANQKLEELKDRFASWIFADAKRADVLVARYNELYNRHVIVDAEAAMKDYDVPNTSESFKARMHQKRAVYRAVYGNSPLLLNHPVGSGKTFTSQMVTMEWKRLGIANKPVIATLKSVVPQYAREFKIAYPNANILVPTEADFSARNRKRLLSTIATGNYDAIIITHDNLKALQNPTETVREIYEERLDELKASMSGAEGRTRSQLQKRIEKLRGKYEEITNVAKDEDVLSFDQLGIDGLIVDESHRFKKIGFSSSMDVKGIDTEESQMAVDLLIKTRHILKSSNNVVLMTGTPITNTLPELFSIQRVLQPKLLKQQGIYEFDSWAKQYTVTETDIETTGVGKLKEITRVKNYTNLDALYASVGQIMDTVTNEEIIANDPTFVLPPLRNGEPTQVILEPSELQEQYAAELDDRLQVVNQKDNPDNYLNIFGDAERMSLDIRFVIPDAPDNPNSKANQSVERAMELYRKYDEVKGVQMIFSDIGIPNKEGRFDLYNDIKKKLVARGVPAKEIALISDYDTAVQKSALSKKARAGEIRFVIGSTTKLGTGVNMQDLLVAEHHLDIPYTPAELEQRYGRILRQGNKLIDQVDGFEVEIFLYATAKTLDGSKWQILKNKMQFIHDFQSGQISESSELDIDEGSQKEQAERMIALTSGNPLLLDRIKAEKKLKKLRALKRGYDYARAGNLRDLEYEKSVLEQSDTIIENIDADREQTENHRIMIGSKQYEKAGELGQAVIDELLKFKESRGLAAKTIGSVGDIDVKIEYNRQNDNAVVSYVGKTKDSTEFKLLTQSPSGLGVRMQNMADPELFVKRAKNQARMKADAEERIPALEKALEERFEKGDELEATETELERINAEMKAEAKNQPKETAEPEEKAELMMAASAEAKAKTTPKARAQQRETEHYARANGYDEAGANYVPTYKISGLPSRPEEGKIAIGDRTIALPTLEAPINADTIRAYLSDIVGNRLYETKIRNNSALGKYSRDDSAIRLKSYSDVEIMAHELAHYLDYFHNNPKRTATGSWFRSQIMKHRDEIEALSYTTKPKEVVAEGFAEFVRLWLTNYNTVKALAPGMVKAFEIRMKQDKELHNKMQLLQEGMHQFYYQGESAMLRGRRGGELNKTAKKIRRSQQEIGKELRQQAIDKLHSIKRIEAKVRGDVAADAIDSPYKLLQLVNGHSAVLYSAMNIGVPTVTAEGDLTYSGKSLNEIFAPATNVGEDRVRLLEDYLVARRAEELTEQGRENLITIEEINTGLELASVYREFETIFEEYQAFNDAMLDFYVDMNLITSTQRETFREFNRNYVPFHRIVESVQNGEVPPSSIGKRLTGGTHSLGNIMENIIDGLDTNIREAMIARGKSVFYDMLEKSGMGGVYATKVGRESRKVQSDVEQQAKKIAQMMVQLGISVSKDGMILSGDMTSGEVYDVREIEENLIANPAALEFWTHGHKPTSTAGYIDSAIIDDKMVYFEVNDPGIVDSITSFRSAHYNEFVRGLMTTKNIMTWNITNNPLFYLTNFMRDTVSGAVLSKNKFLPVISSMTGIYHFVTKSKSYKEFMAAGGGYGTRRTALGKEIDAMTLLKVNRGFEVVGRVASAMEYGADIFEYGTRLGDFFLAQESGKSNMQAAYEAREVSTDFAVKGSNMGLTGFMATVPFMKAAVNGLDKTARRVFTLNGEMKLSNAAKFRNQLGELQTHKIKLYATGGILTTLSLGLWLQNRDDERFKKLTRDQKMLYWNFFIGDRHIKIPKPYDIGFAFASLPELIADGTYTKHGKEAAEDFLWGLKTMFSIGDVSGMFQPVLEQMTNTNWMGSPIVPYHMRNMDDLGDQYFSTTPLMYRKLGELTGASPILTQHYVDGYLGLTAKMIEEITENMLWNTKEWGARPFAKDPLEFLTYRFSGRKVEPRTKYSEKYYELMERASAVQASYSAKRKAAVIDKGEDVKEYMSSKEKQAYVAVDKMMRQYQKLLTNIKLAVEAITYDRKLTKAQKEQKINDAYTARTELFKTVTENLEEELKKLEGK
jgi:N12 class adenine-specific DNA methylase